MTLYHVNVNNVHVLLYEFIFVAAIDYENIFTVTISRFTVHVHDASKPNLAETIKLLLDQAHPCMHAKRQTQWA